MSLHEESGAVRVSPVADQLRRGFAWLRFGSDLEPVYRQEQYRQSLPYLRLSLGTAFLVFVAMALLVQVVLHGAHASPTDLARYAVPLIALVIALAVTLLENGSRLYRPVISALAPVVIVAVVAMVLAAWGHGEARVFTALILAALLVYFLLGLPFMTAVVVNVISLGAYVYGALMLSVPLQDLTYNAVMLLLTIGVGAVAAYNVEHTRRTIWLESRLLDEVAQHDGLTGIYNRRRFDEHLAKVWQQGAREHRPIALLLVDIDHFKAFNDRYGHQAGDEALKAVAGILTRVARRPMDLVARYGGEEFAIVLYDALQDYAVRAADQIMEETRKLGIPHDNSGAASILTISVGIACIVPVPRRSSAGLVQLADQALYAAKDGGRNQSRLFQAEYEHMQTGYFRRHLARGGEPKAGQ